LEYRHQIRVLDTVLEREGLEHPVNLRFGQVLELLCIGILHQAARVAFEHLSGSDNSSNVVLLSRGSLVDGKSDLTINYARGRLLTAQATDLDPARILAGSASMIMRPSALARSGKARYYESCFSVPK
jgi:hypothetical protein